MNWKYLPFLLFIPSFLFAQSPFETLRGQLTDADSHFPLIGATIALLKDTNVVQGTTTDNEGNYRFENVSVGRHNLRITYIGYGSIFIPNIIVTSAKEAVENISMQPLSVSMNEVVIHANRVGESSNEMSAVSARNFSVEETNRYAGSRGDPARMASDFAGVQGGNDSRNDIIIRGNSPGGVLWRLEGVDIFNPNHFSEPGTTGGPVTILNNKILANSDFYTGAFPADYGNSTAGVFDLRMRSGNNEKYEFSGQLGFLGTELDGEGPLNKMHKSSFLFTYRYSTLALFSALNINIGTDAIPHYQDASFRLNFPLKNNADFAVWGLGGLSRIDILISKQKKPSTQLYGENDRDQHFKSGMGAAGITFNKAYSLNSFMKTTISLQGERQVSFEVLVFRHVGGDGNYVIDSLSPVLNYAFRTTKITGSWYLSHKLNTHWLLKGGVNADMLHFNLNDSAKNTDPDTSMYLHWRRRWNTNDNAFLIQPYIEAKFSPNDKLSVVAGMHSLYFSLSNSWSLEPRLGITYQLPNSQMLSAGTGLFSQIQSPYLYYYNPNLSDLPGSKPFNLNMGLTKSAHIVLGYTKFIDNVWMIKAETYYEYLFNIPVETHPSSVSLINAGEAFTRVFPDTLVNKGIGYNAGIELTIEKSFTHHYYVLFTGSLYTSKYRGSDTIWRNTDYDGVFAVNALFSKEFIFKNRNAFEMGGKVTLAGGHLYGPVDTLGSVQHQQVQFVDRTYNSWRLPDYFRADVKLDYRINRPKMTHETGIDFVNIFGIKNILNFTYSDNPANHIIYNYQLGFLPLFYYRIDFGIK